MMHPFESHLFQRCKSDADKYGIVDCENELFTRYLFNLSGQIVGYQKYNHRAEKVAKNHPSLGRYFTYLTDGKIACAGLDNIECSKPLYLVEGIFEQITATEYGLNCIAVLCNSPKHLRNFLACWPHRVVALCQDDSAGLKLRNLADDFIVLPQDLDDMNREDVIRLIQARCRE